MADIRIRLNAFHGHDTWRIVVSANDDPFEADLPALPEALPETFGSFHSEAQRWSALPSFFAPSPDTTQPSLSDLKQLGAYLHQCLLSDPNLAAHLDRLRRQNPGHRLLFATSDRDGWLRQLPVELMFDEPTQQFWSRVPELVLAREVVNTRNLSAHLPKTPALLIATAHSERHRHPTARRLIEHAGALSDVARGLGWEVRQLDYAKRESLREAILAGADLVYVACHGEPDADLGGHLLLLDGKLSGADFGEWIEESRLRTRAPTAAVLCACSSGSPARNRSTHGMAEYLVHKVSAAVGFSAPVTIKWALEFGTRLFNALGGGAPFDQAFAEARRRSPLGDPQWALPVLYTRRRPRVEPIADSPVRSTPVPPPRPYFTGRQAYLEQLTPLLDSPSTTVVTSVEGAGGMGKTELARWLAHTAKDRGMPVIWLERPDRSIRRALETMIRCAQPDFRLRSDTSTASISQHMREVLGVSRGLVVLDDLASTRDIESLEPGPSWSVLITTRAVGLHPAAHPIELKAMDRDEAVELLGRLCFGSAAGIPEHPRKNLTELAELLEDLPLALTLAGRTIYEQRLTPRQYLKELRARIGQAGEDYDYITEVLACSLDDQMPEVVRTFLVLGAFPLFGALARDVADALSVPEPVATRWLSLLTRVRLAAFDTDSGYYRLHPRLHEEAWRRLGRDELGTGLATAAALVLTTRVQQIYKLQLRSIEESFNYWTSRAKQLTALVPMRWMGHPGRGHIASVIGLIDQYIAVEVDPEKREENLTSALALTSDTMQAPRALILRARANARSRTGRHAAAEDDYNEAIRLFRAMGSDLDTASVLVQLGRLRYRTGRLGQALVNCENAISLFQAGGDRLGEAQALRTRGDIRCRLGHHDRAADDYEAALSLFRLLKDQLDESNTLKARGDLHDITGRRDAAEADYQAAILLSRNINDHVGEANALQARGDLRRRANRLNDAEADYSVALASFRGIKDYLGEANTLLALGEVYAEKQRFTKAEHNYDAAISLYRNVGARLGEANALQARGTIRAQAGRLDEAQADYEAAIPLAQADKASLSEAKILIGRGELDAQRGRLPNALQWYLLARELYAQTKYKLGISTVDTALARLHSELDDPEAAVNAALRALTLGVQVQNHYAVTASVDILRRHPDMIHPDVRSKLAEILDDDDDLPMAELDEESLQRDFRAKWSEGNHQFVFIDDGGAGHHNFDPSVLVQDHLTFTAVFVPPASLPALHAGHSTWLDAAQKDAPDLRELHATRLINPKRGHAWHGVSVGTRVAHLLAAAKILLPHVDMIVYGHIGREQYEELVLPVLEDPPPGFDSQTKRDLKKHKRGLERAFHIAIASAVMKTGTPTFVIQDEDKLRNQIKVCFHEDVPIWQQGIIYHPSEEWPGIQVADLLSVAISRTYRIKDKALKGQDKNPFDLACEEILGWMSGKLVDAWLLGDL